MEDNPKMQTAVIIVSGLMKLLWYLFLAAVGILIFITLLVLEASKPKHNKNR